MIKVLEKKSTVSNRENGDHEVLTQFLNIYRRSIHFPTKKRQIKKKEQRVSFNKHI